MAHLSKNVSLLLFVLLLLIALLSGLQKIRLRAEEPRRALSALETIQYGQGIPHITGEAYYNKPPLYIIIQGLTIQALGSSKDWAVRLPGMLSFLLSGMLLFWFAKQYLTQETAILGTLIYYTSGDLLFYGSVYSGEMDLFYALLVILQVFGVYASLKKGQWWQLFLILYTCTFIGLMTKGLPSAVFHASLLGLIVWEKRQFGILFHPAHFVGILLLFVGLWGSYLLYDQRGNALVYALSLLSESAEKSAGAYGFSRIIGHVFKFPLQFLALMLPWSLLFLGLRRKHLQQMPEALKFLMMFVLVNVLVYWISPGTRNRYLYMFLPMMAIWMAHLSQQIKYKRVAEWVIISAMIVLMFLGISTFIPGIFAHIPAYTGFLCLFLSAMLLMIYTKWKPNPLVTLSIAVLLLRIGFNYTYLPEADSRSESQRYARHSSEMMRVADGSEIFLYGSESCIPLKLPFFPKAKSQVKKCTPPLLPYQIPWEYYRKSGKFIIYSRELNKGSLFLCHVSALPENTEVLYRFLDEWNRQEMVLFREK